MDKPNKKVLAIQKRYGLNTCTYLATIRGKDYFLLGTVIDGEPQPTGLPIVVEASGYKAVELSSDESLKFIKLHCQR